MNESRKDRLYELLPAIHRIRDAEQGEPLRALLRVITEQVNLLEDDIGQLYENWFIETCEDWVVPYLGDLIGYETMHEAGEPSTVNTPQEQQRNKILIPRRDVANTICYRQRKGTLALLELLSNDVAGWPARVVEFAKLLSWTQAINYQQPACGRTADLRKGSALELLDSPFDTFAHTVDVRQINSQHSQGWYNIPSIGVFVWRIKPYSVSYTPAYCLESPGPHCFTFNVLGNDTQLYMQPEPETDPTHIADEFNLPVPIRRSFFQEQLEKLYGEGKSLQILVGKKQGEDIVNKPVPIEKIIPADLSDWRYVPPRNKVAVDPVLGRIAFPARHYPEYGVQVSYHYGFSMDLGGGEYERQLVQPKEARTYQVVQQNKPGQYPTIQAALEQWRCDIPSHAVIEILDSEVYVEQVEIIFREGQESLQLRAANGCRPVIRLLDIYTDRPDSLIVAGEAGARLTLDGLLITGRSLQIAGDLAELTLRHTTLVPGWAGKGDGKSRHYTEPALEINSPRICVTIDHCILGAIQVDPYLPELAIEDEDVEQNTVYEEAIQARCQGIGQGIRLDPIRICVNDSILDATDSEFEVLGAPSCIVAHAVTSFQRSTVIGQVQAHAVTLGEDSIFYGKMTVARRQIGCLRFCYVSPGSRTPKRYRCQPDLVRTPILKKYQEKNKPISDDEQAELQQKLQQEETRVRPNFNKRSYGTPDYCQLADDCAEEIKRGAEDESEMGVFHNLYQPQRMANLRARLNEYVPARTNIGIILSN
jgi:hypothetical protein